MSNPIKGKVVVIPGAGSSLGEATARLLAAQGAHLVLGAESITRLESLAGELESSGGQVITMAMDVTRRDQVQDLVNAAMRTFGRMDVMVSTSQD
ncbi:SDR family NAD(P)-dependent oxidoreductase [Luteolibacter ambystomatis]|uniref:SDR family NAD(P)-dependent oxidoreductase n=1 Tax=Luteolibacter ambystomatis TaxID=2824561 RepID=A0A975J1I2_9BACT|nr:SDR family NAD(P)-dependent oxidoreductase [Luteolibacter ambystomatis]QUE52308.1 SDR family NAD(P)-dependent oxidoreductase [Luteolibacter ambystomatis]